MLFALLADIHANREAFSACLAHAEALHAQRYVFLGDHVGYGADPGWAVDQIMSYVEAGAIAIRGNHDEAVFNTETELNETARTAIAWTREQLNARQRDFLQGLPLAVEDDDRLYVHASADVPASWNYLTGPTAAMRSFTATPQRVTFCGHMHVPELYHLSAAGKLAAFTPIAGAAIPLMRKWRWLAIIGSVGQPREGIPAASYALFDDEHNTLTYMHVPYDAAGAAAKVRAAGLPAVLSLRLLQGR